MKETPGSAAEQTLDYALDLSTESLSPENRAKLSKALFPETHTDEVRLLGTPRKLWPVPIKVARAVYTLLKDYAEVTQEDGSVEESMTREAAMTEYDTRVLSNLKQIAVILGGYYKWDDVVKAAGDEELSLTELESLAFVQQELNSANDFLLQPLRIFVKMLQAREIAMLHLENSLSMFTTQPSANSGDAPSTT